MGELTTLPGPLTGKGEGPGKGMAAADPGGFVGFGRTPPPGGVVVENARTAWLYQSSSVRDIFTQIVPQLYTT